MQLAETDGDRYWHEIAAHTAASSHIGAPWPVHIQAAALVGNSSIEASVANFDGTGPSTWAVTLITADARLIRIRMEFDTEQYDDEQDRIAREPVPGTVKESWVRKLGDVEKLGVGSSRMRPTTLGRTMPNVLDVADVALTFRGGAVIDADIDQVSLTMYDDRRRSDGFVDLLRRHTGL